MEIKKKNTYMEHEIVIDGTVVGEVEIEPQEKELSRLVIFEPYRNKGYGQSVVTKMVQEYGVNSLWVRSDNERAIHVYEKCGFVRSKETMFEMKLREVIPNDSRKRTVSNDTKPR